MNKPRVVCQELRTTFHQNAIRIRFETSSRRGLRCKLREAGADEAIAPRQLFWSTLRRCCSFEMVITGCPGSHSSGLPVLSSKSRSSMNWQSYSN